MEDDYTVSDGVSTSRAASSTAAVPEAQSTVTIKDVARMSGVSVATVTRALQGRTNVRPDTRRRVEEAAATLGYRPDLNARALVTGETRTLGLLIPSSGDRFWGEVVVGIEERAAEAGFSVLLANSHHDLERERRMAEIFFAKRVDAIVVGAAVRRPDEWFGRNDRRVPIVTVNFEERLSDENMAAVERLAPGEMLSQLGDSSLAPWVGQVWFDDVGAATTATRHLIGLGHRRIAFLGAAPLRSALLRVVGFRLACEQSGIAPGPISPCQPTLEDARAAALQLLSGTGRPTAVVAYDDIVAIATLRAAHALGLHVPNDVSVVGFDDIDVAAFVEPQLTTVRQPKAKMGRLAADLLLRSLNDQSAGREMEPGTLVVRSSTAPPPALATGRG